MAVDTGAVLRGALGAVMLFGPVVLILRALAGGDVDSGAWMLLVPAFLFSFSFGGWVAAYDRPRTPLIHGTIAGGLGFVAVVLIVLPFRLVDGTVTINFWISAVVFLQIAATLGLLGGLLAHRGVRTGRR